jgi:glycerol-3-phosphate cytidylyltransferase
MKDFIGKPYCEESVIELYYNKRERRFSSSELRKLVAEIEIKKID